MALGQYTWSVLAPVVVAVEPPYRQTLYRHFAMVETAEVMLEATKMIATVTTEPLPAFTVRTAHTDAVLLGAWRTLRMQAFEKLVSIVVIVQRGIGMVVFKKVV